MAASSNRLKIGDLFLLVFILFCSVPVPSNGFALMTDVSNKVQGAVADPVNASLFYQSYVPLIFKFRIPDWSLESLRLNKSLKCPKDDLGGDFICPISKYMDDVLNPLSETMRFYRNIFNATGGQLYEINFSCDRIRPHFLHFSAQQGGLLPYIAEFRTRCPLGKNATLTVKNLVSPSNQHATLAFQKFRELHEAKEQKIVSGTPTTAPTIDWKSLQTAGYIAIQNSYLMSLYADSVRWSNAFTSCQSYKLDIGIVSPFLLNDSLTELAEALKGSGYTFALPFINNMPHYYKIPLVDCMITMGHNPSETANLIVRILVPVIKSGMSYRTYKLNKVPFLKKGKERGLDKICEVQNFQADDIYLVERNTSTKMDTVLGRISPLCATSKLCKIPDVTHRQIIDPCVAAAIKDNAVLTSQRCHYECYTVPQSILQRGNLFPIVTQLRSNEYSITGLVPNMSPMLLLECVGKATQMFKPNTSEGAILVTLPCDCELVHGTRRFKAQKPCRSRVEVKHILEYDEHRKDEEDEVDYVVDVPLDENAYNITFKPSKLQNITTTSPPPAHMTTQHHIQYHCGHVVLWLFLFTIFILNLFTLYILQKNGLLSFKNVFIWRGTTSHISRLQNERTVTGSTVM